MRALLISLREILKIVCYIHLKIFSFAFGIFVFICNYIIVCFNPFRTIGLIRPKNIFLLKMDKYGLKSYSFYFFLKIS